METEDWTHPDISLPRFLSVVRSFLDMLLLASGYQPSGSPARWRTEDIIKALGWASLLEQIMKKALAEKECPKLRQSLDTALQHLMLETPYPEGLPKLSWEVLAEAKTHLTLAICNALSPCNGQMESLLDVAHDDTEDWAVVLEQIQHRHKATSAIKSVTKAIGLATPVLDTNIIACGCQRWRQRALTYLLDGKTLYKLSGATVLFECDEVQWKAALQRISCQADGSTSLELAEMCCLHMSRHRQSGIIARLLEPCRGSLCSVSALKVWLSERQEAESKDASAVDAYLYEVVHMQEVWWNLPPILVAVSLTKGSRLFRSYAAELCRCLEKGKSAEICERMEKGRKLEDSLVQADDVLERSWCLQLLQDID